MNATTLASRQSFATRITNRLNTASLSRALALAVTLAICTSAQAVELSFYANVPLQVTQCFSLPQCDFLAVGDTTPGSISGTFEIADPLSNTKIEIFNLINFAYSAPFPYYRPHQLIFEAEYLAPSSLGEVGQVSIISLYSSFNHIELEIIRIHEAIWEYDYDSLRGNITLKPVGSSPLTAKTNFVYAVPEPSAAVLSLAVLGLYCGRWRTGRSH